MGDAVSPGTLASCHRVWLVRGGISLPFRVSIVASISACHAEDPGSIPGLGVVQTSVSVAL